MAETQFYTDRYKFTAKENRRFAWANLTQVAHTKARFEGVNGLCHKRKRSWTVLSIAGVPVEDVLTIVNLKQRW